MIKKYLKQGKNKMINLLKQMLVIILFSFLFELMKYGYDYLEGSVKELYEYGESMLHITFIMFIIGGITEIIKYIGNRWP